MVKAEKLILIDGNAFCYRAYYAIKRLTSSKGFATNAIYGFTTMLNKIIEVHEPTHIAVAFDRKEPTFRHKMYKEYKITRKPMPDDLVTQIPYIKKIVEGYNIAACELPGYEADDIIATVAKEAEKKNFETLIITGDKDILQIVTPSIKVCDTHKEGLIYDETKIKERFSVGPGAITDIMALMGDATDNIPGIPGIGEKGAIELIKEFGTLKNLLSNADKVKSKAKKELIKQHAKLAEMSKELATLDCNVPIDVDIDKMRLKEPDKEKLLELFRELEFKSLMNQFATRKELKAQYDLIDTEDKFSALLGEAKKAKVFVFDFETTGTSPMTAEPIGISFCWKEGEAHYVAFAEKGPLKKEKVLDQLRPTFEDESIKKIGQNIKYEILILKNKGIDLKGVEFDTMIASYLLNPSKIGHGLGDISLEYLNHKMISITDLIGKGKKQISMKDVDVMKVCNYSCEDSDVTFRLKKILEKELSKKDLDELFYNVEMPLIKVLADMEFNGVCIDTNFLKELDKELSSALKKSESEIYKLADAEFNINSPKQLSEILYSKLKLPVIKRTKTGFSTDERTLRQLALRHELPEKLLSFRELSKLKSTYIDALPKIVNPKTGRVHTSFNQTITATGRLSSSQPNLQNIPIRTELGREIRRSFIPTSKDRLLLSCDYSQIELRVLAHLSEDVNLTEAFRKDLDIHVHTASLVFGEKEENVDSRMRNTAKTVNFGIVYGMSAYGLSRDLGIDIEEAKAFIDSYFERYPKVKAYIEECIEFARNSGFVTTLMNRRRYIPEINSDDIKVRQFAERTAINTPIQGSAADIIKLAMLHVNKALAVEAPETGMILQVHDELVFDVAKDKLEKTKKIVKDCMEKVVNLKVPLKANISAGKNWLGTK